MKRISLTTLFLFITLPWCLKAQRISWEAQQDARIPDGIGFYAGTNSSGQAVKAWYVEIPADHPAYEVVPVRAKSGSASVDEISTEYNAIFALNGGFFSGGTSVSSMVQYAEVVERNVTALNRGGVTLPVIRSAAVWRDNGTNSIEYVYHRSSTADGMWRFDAPLPYQSNATQPIEVDFNASGAGSIQNLLHAIGGGPVLVKDSTVNITYNEEIFWGSGVGRDDPDPRSALGFKSDGSVILMVVDGRQSVSFGMSLPEVARELLALGCVEGINLDGGGSSQMAFDGDFVNRPAGGIRDVVTALAVVEKGSLNPENEEGVRQTTIIDTENGQGIGEWFATANDGFWGETRSMLHATLPTADTSAYFIYPLITDSVQYITDGANFNIDMWWVASSNRSQRVRIELVNGDGNSTQVEVDQVQNGSQWVPVFTDEFLSTNGGSSPVFLKIYANTGENNRFVVADGIRIQELTTTSNTNENESLPTSFAIKSAYPNPFNPTTQLQFELNSSGVVSFEVFNMMGQSVYTLAPQNYTSGTYIRSFNFSSLPSGLYIIRASFNGPNGLIIQSQKVSLIR